MEGPEEPQGVVIGRALIWVPLRNVIWTIGGAENGLRPPRTEQYSPVGPRGLERQILISFPLGPLQGGLDPSAVRHVPKFIRIRLVSCLSITSRSVLHHVFGR